MNKYHIPSISNTCSILQLLQASNRTMRGSDIAKELDLPVTSVFRTLKTLEAEGMVRKIGKSYVIGHRMIHLGLRAVSQISERLLCVPILQELTTNSKRSSHFAILSGSNMLVMEVCDSMNTEVMALRPGTLVDMHCSASGKCILAFAASSDQADFLDSIPLTRHTESTHTNVDSLKLDLQETKTRGYSIENLEHTPNTRAIGAPVFNSLNQLAGVIGISASKSKLPTSHIPNLAKEVVTAARKLSTKLGNQQY